MKKKQVGTLFPNTNPIAGFYSPTSFCITLNAITTRQLSEMGKDKLGYTEKRKLLYHEVRHHMDHLSTLWGHQRIFALQQAVDAKFSKNEQKFYKIAEYKISEKQFHFYKYYTTNRGTATYKTPLDRWVWQITSGTRFNNRGETQSDKPILFIKFASPSGDAHMRVPLTIGSLLEVNAIYEETVVEKDVINRVDDNNRLKAKQGYVNRLIRDVVYNQDMIEYNGGVHVVANHFRIYDPHEAYSIASSIATLALNIPSELVSTIPIDQQFQEVWGNRPQDFVSEYNHGFLFFNMVNNYKEHFKKNKLFDINEFLAVNKLPTENELQETIISKMEENINAIGPEGYFCNFFKEQLNAGITLFQRRGIDGKRESLEQTFFSGEYIPFIVTSDTTFTGNLTFDDIYQSAEITKTVEITDWYHLSDEVNEHMEEFYNICGI